MNSDGMEKLYRSTFIILTTIVHHRNIRASNGYNSKIEDINICKANRNETWTVGLIYCNGSNSPGYTFFHLFLLQHHI